MQIGRRTNDQKAKTTSKQRDFSRVLQYLLNDREVPDGSSHGLSHMRGVINKARRRIEVVFARVSALLRPEKLVDILYVRRDAQRLRTPNLDVAIVRAGLGDMDGRAAVLPRPRQAAGPPLVVVNVPDAYWELSRADDTVSAGPTSHNPDTAGSTSHGPVTAGPTLHISPSTFAIVPNAEHAAAGAWAGG